MCDDYKIEGDCCRQDRGCLGQQKRLTIAERAGDRIPQYYLAASTGPALALGRTADKPAWAAPPQGWHRRAPEDKDFCHAEHSDVNKQAREAQLWIPTPAPGSTKQ